MYWLITIHSISIAFMGLSAWLMIRYLRKYKVPESHYQRLWGFFRIKYLLWIYAFSVVGWGALSITIFYALESKWL
ncbi:MAG: hypothetical protein ACD_65C00183G0001 [uncultured bacterium]|nr:MAG: hypothetical protein ACD_65C00183G0001 [uncultured bacterium]KKT02211.1 MAG: hypothetical protein UV80_C0005G0056 [Candidatus Peregrinibacteria bacterium GW2011_GWF2_43_17]HAU40028.1 hypothetical protein [Candidatus Peregrinibacteria bacterium]